MIDIENMLFTAVKTALPDNVKCGVSYTKIPGQFPFFTLIVEDNKVYERFIDSAQIENAADIMVEINAYSNKSSGKKEECKAIIKQADEVLSGFNLTRTFCRPTPNLEDSTVYRMTARYKAVVDTNYNIYRR